MDIPFAVPGTVKAWFRPLVDERTQPLPDGPWQREPSKVQWVDAATGFPCLIVRGPGGSLCGYAGVPPGHPLHKTDDSEFDVHGGVTFTGGCAHSTDESQGICHIPEPGTSDDIWWFGFDCAHLGDLMPEMLNISPKHGESMRGTIYEEHYRDVDYVAGEARSLAKQLAELARA
jgi:hypothetical protein